MRLRHLVLAAILAGSFAAGGCLCYTTPSRSSVHGTSSATMRTHVSTRPHTVRVEYWESLSPYGQWVQSSPYGHVWCPSSRVVGSNWQPYSNGHWVYTEQGWTWQSNYDWGWAAFHYGRWTRVSGCGWAWVPGDVWGPAWVVWRHGGGYTGWAPAPPRYSYAPGRQRVSVDNRHYVYVHTRNLTEHRVVAHRVPEHEVIPARQRSHEVVASRPGSWGPNPYYLSPGPDPDEVSRHTGHRVVPRQTRVVEDPSAGHRTSPSGRSNSSGGHGVSARDSDPVRVVIPSSIRRTVGPRSTTPSQSVSPGHRTTPDRNRPGSPRVQPSGRPEAAPRSTPPPTTRPGTPRTQPSSPPAARPLMRPIQDRRTVKPSRSTDAEKDDDDDDDDDDKPAARRAKPRRSKSPSRTKPSSDEDSRHRVR